jgi:hypothetical protein
MRQGRIQWPRDNLANLKSGHRAPLRRNVPGAVVDRHMAKAPVPGTVSPAPLATSDVPVTSLLQSVLAWAGASAGITGVLTATGYLVHSARGQFLGVATDTPNSTIYLQLAGDFWIGSIIQLVGAIADIVALITANYGAAILVVALTFAGLFVWRWLGSPFTGPRVDRLRPVTVAATHPTLLAVFLLALGLVRVVYFDVPAVQINSVLLSTISCPRQWSLPPLMAARASTVWQNIVCSRGAAPDCECGNAADHTRALRFEFVIAASTAIGLAAWSCVIAFSAWRSSSITRPHFHTRLLLGGAALLGMISLALLPQLFAKTLYSTAFPLGRLFVHDQPHSLNGHLIAQDSEAVTMFTEDKAIVTFPRRLVDEIEMTDSSDVLIARFGMLPAAPR